MNETFDVAGVLSALRRTVTRREPTPAEARDLVAGWWEALHAELVSSRRDTLHGGPNLRVGPEDVEYAHLMSVWMRHEARDAEWRADEANLRAAEFWKANRPADDAEAKRQYALLPDMIRERLASRPTPPDRRNPPLPRPRNYTPDRWPPISPGVPWSTYLSLLLTEFRARAGIVDREPGDDREEDAAQ